jgi:peptidoglycan/xylan/chitin deacetylase (PgdA/CDA1 family)
MNHVNGWKSNNNDYIENVKNCAAILEEEKTCNLIFRPPYGKIKKAQSKILRNLGYKIIMWDVLSADFDQSITPEKCLENVTKNVKSGSVIVFHDSIKASQNLKFALPKTLHFLKENGYKFDIIH